MKNNYKAKRLAQYFGALGPKQVAEGMNLALQNARRLLQDAQTLFENGRYPSAAALAILSIEEAGKLAVLRELSLARNQQELRILA
jgi:AbiV family abortive infection protein